MQERVDKLVIGGGMQDETIYYDYSQGVPKQGLQEILKSRRFHNIPL